jgi:hypothetical protein
MVSGRIGFYNKRQTALGIRMGEVWVEERDGRAGRTGSGGGAPQQPGSQSAAGAYYDAAIAPFFPVTEISLALSLLGVTCAAAGGHQSRGAAWDQRLGSDAWIWLAWNTIDHLDHLHHLDRLEDPEHLERPGY